MSDVLSAAIAALKACAYTYRRHEYCPRLLAFILPVLLTLLISACDNGGSGNGPPLFPDDPNACAGKVPQGQAVLSITRTSQVLEVETATDFLTITPWSDRIVQVKAHKSANWIGTEFNPAVIAKPATIKWSCSQDDKGYTVSTSLFRVRIAKATAAISFLDLQNNVLLEEPEKARDLPTPPILDLTPQAATQIFKSPGLVYGLGQHKNGMMNYNGSKLWLQQRAEPHFSIAVPFLVAQKGFGVLWNNTSIVEVELPPADDVQAGKLIFKSQVGAGIDYHFVYGPEIDDVVGGYRFLTGDVPMMPRWAWGLWQSRERYKTQDEIISIARKYRDLSIPLDLITQDWQYWRENQWGSFAFDPARYPDPKGMIDQLHEMNVRANISAWPNFDLGVANRAEHEKLGSLYPDIYDNNRQWYDPFNDKGRELLWSQIKSVLGNAGFDAWWLDGNEPELVYVSSKEVLELKTARGPGRNVVNAWPLMHNSGVFAGMRKDFPNKRVVLLSRSAYAGAQRLGAISWSGDTYPEWSVLAKEVPAGLNFSVSGIPYWGGDIGAFYNGRPGDKEWDERFTRWFQFAAFTPNFRIHGTAFSETNKPREIWVFNEITRKILIDYDKLRYRLIPYIYSISWDVTARRGTMMRPLVMDFRDDAKAVTIPDQYMFGKAILVSPVTKAGATTRVVYLPGKDAWYDYWTGVRHEGAQAIAAKASIETMPLYVRSGSILPLGPDIQYAGGLKSKEPVELRIYPGRDGSFELYDDAGDGYGYEKGEKATVQLTWNDGKQQLTIGTRNGQFPGMERNQVFRVTCGAKTEAEIAPQQVTYDGTQTQVSLARCK